MRPVAPALALSLASTPAWAWGPGDVFASIIVVAAMTLAAVVLMAVLKIGRQRGRQANAPLFLAALLIGALGSG